MTIDFQSALRAEMLDRVERTRLPGWRRRLPVITAGVALALGGAGVAAANGWLSEGDRSIEVLGDPVSLTVDEPTVLNLGAMPEQADAVQLTVRCLSAGMLHWPGGGSTRCSAGEQSSSTFDVVAIDPASADAPTLTLADVEGDWEISWVWVSVEMRPFERNANGLTYGSSGYGNPDLVAVTYGGEEAGYVYAEDFSPPDPSDPAEAAARDSAPVAVPIFASDGETPLGVWLTTGRPLAPGEQAPDRPPWSQESRGATQNPRGATATPG